MLIVLRDMMNECYVHIRHRISARDRSYNVTYKRECPHANVKQTREVGGGSIKAKVWMKQLTR